MQYPKFRAIRLRYSEYPVSGNRPVECDAIVLYYLWSPFIHIEAMRLLFRSLLIYPLPYLLACVAGVGLLTLFPFNFRQPNNAVISDGLTLSYPGTAYAAHPHEALSSLYHFTIVLHCTPKAGEPGRIGRILSSAKDGWSQNFAITQWGRGLNIQFFSRDSRQFNEMTVENVFATRAPVWIAITFNGETLRCYVNGVKKAERHTGPMALAQWKAEYPLVVGTDPNGGLQWEGSLHRAAIFDRTFSRGDLRRPGLIFKHYSSIIHYNFDKGHTPYVRSTGTDADSMYVPPLYKPYDRITLLDTYRLLGKQRLYVRDIIANIFFFLPVGFFSAMFLGRSFKNSIAIVILSVIFGLLLSACVECLQIDLPSRFSSMFDVVSNTAGAAIGAAIALRFTNYNQGTYNDERRLAEDRSRTGN